MSRTSEHRSFTSHLEEEVDAKRREGVKPKALELAAPPLPAPLPEGGREQKHATLGRP
jgi:hypothetical protein